MDDPFEKNSGEPAGDSVSTTTPDGGEQEHALQLPRSGPSSFADRLRNLLQRDFGVGGISPTYYISRWVFLRMLGVIHLVAFASFWSQLDGLIGSNGIAPASMLLDIVKHRVPGSEHFWMLPTLCWFGVSDGALHLICAAGVIIALLLIIGIASPLCLAALYVLYLSLVSVAPDFLSFQWDSLLLETTFLAIWFAPWRLLPGVHREEVHSRVMLMLLRWLLFRLMFSSGIVKLNDETWRNLTALTYHYETQPLPTVFGWFAGHLPVWFQMASVVGMFFIEIVVPFLLLAPRRVRAVAFGLLIFLQLLIMLTGNYTFFNLLAIALCILILDDRHWKAIIPTKLWEWIQFPTTHRKLRLPRKIVALAIAAVIVIISGSQIAQLLPPHLPPPDWLWTPSRAIWPFELINRYGLFASMTKERLEIVIEGSNDGQNWLPYEFRWKPGDLNRHPGWVQPFQPRLDWQMWFAALSSRPPAWFQNLAYRLLQGKPEVSALFESNPFSNNPPRYVHALSYRYRFTDLRTWHDTGAWWKRELVGEYMNPQSLRPPKAI